MRRSESVFLFGGGATIALLAACGGESLSGDGGSGGTGGSSVGASGGAGGVTGGTGASGGSGGSISGAAGMSGSGGRCQGGLEVTIERLCVRGVPVENGEYIAEGTEFRIELYPQGCFSSSCTTILDASCTVTVSGMMGDELLISGGICHGSRVGEGVPCTDDCGGGGIAECPVEPLPAKTYFAIYDDPIYTDLIVAFDVPSLVEPGGRCFSRVPDGPPPRDERPAQSPEAPAP